MYDNLDTDAARERAADMRRAARERGAEFSQAIAAGANTVAEFCRDTHYNARNMHPFSEADFPVSQHFKHNNGSEYWNLYLASRLGVALHTPFTCSTTSRWGAQPHAVQQAII